MGILLPQYDDEELRRIIINYNEILENIQQYSGKHLEDANNFLDKHLTSSEKSLLYNSYYSDKGWFRSSSHSEGAIKLKIAALSLALTNNIFSFTEAQNTLVQEVYKSLSDEEFALLQSCYLKQKIITNKTLMNRLGDPGFRTSQIKLYRGVKSIESINHKVSLESWTSDREVAIRFSDDGYVFCRKVSFSNIYLFYQSAFQWNENPLQLNQEQFVYRETEYIVENIDDEITKVEGIDYLLAEDILKGSDFNDY